MLSSTYNLVFFWIMNIRINYINVLCRSHVSNLVGIMLGNKLAFLYIFKQVRFPQTYYSPCISYPLLCLILNLFVYPTVFNLCLSYVLLSVGWGMRTVRTVLRTLRDRSCKLLSWVETRAFCHSQQCLWLLLMPGGWVLSAVSHLPCLICHLRSLVLWVGLGSCFPMFNI